MLNTLPLDLIQAVQDLMETHDVLETCVDCGAVSGSCIHANLAEDGLSAMFIPNGDEPEAQLSGGKEDVVINPEYKTFTSRRP